MPDEVQLSADHLQDSSALAFARSLFHAAEGKESFDQGFVFASAVSTYYVLFHLGAALILAYCSHSASAGDPHASLRHKLEMRWGKSRAPTSPGSYPDPAEAIKHDDVPAFLQSELPEIFRALGNRNGPGTLRDMREFVSYAPRMVRDGSMNVLFSGCQYEAPKFKDQLVRHLDSMNELFQISIQWMNQSGHNEVRSRLLGGDFVLFEFAELRLYHPEFVAKRAWATYRSVCEHAGVDWRIYRGSPTIFHIDDQAQCRRYSEAVQSLS